MDKTVYAGLILISSILIAGSLWLPEHAGMWLASTSFVMNLARVVLIALMFGLLMTDPPRRRDFRLLLGMTAAVFAAWALGRVWSGSVQVMDALLFLQAAVAFGIAALEVQPLPRVVETEPLTPARLFADKFSATSNMQGLVIPQVRIAEFMQRSVIIAAVVSGAIYHNMRPYRALWRGG